jgi:hypothetical protein
MLSYNEQFDKLPRLLGRATVEFVLEKPVKGDKFDVEGTLYDQARLVSWTVCLLRNKQAMHTYTATIVA